MAKKLPKAQRSIDPGFSQPGRSTRRPNDPGMSRPGTNIPNNDPGFARGSKKDFEKGIVKGILALNPPKKPSIDQFVFLNEFDTAHSLMKYQKTL